MLKPGGAFRFNARYWDPNCSFGDGFGGRLSKVLHRIGWHSSLKSGRLQGVTPDFKGLLFTLQEVEQLLRSEGFLPEQFNLSFEGSTAASGYVRVRCHRSR